MHKKVKELKSYFQACISAYMCVTILTQQNKDSDAYKCNELHKQGLKELQKKEIDFEKLEVILQEIQVLISKNK